MPKQQAKPIPVKTRRSDALPSVTLMIQRGDKQMLVSTTFQFLVEIEVAIDINRS